MRPSLPCNVSDGAAIITPLLHRITQVPNLAMAPPPLKVLIVGGGVAGPALAHWLARIGAHITIAERSPDIRTTGQQIDLRAQGVPLMQRMGIEASVRAARVREPGMQFVDTRGRTRAFFPAFESGTGRQGISSEFEIMRGDLVRILHDLTADHPRVRRLFSTTVDAFTQDDIADPAGRVHVRFHDGRREAFDLVVGAEGTGSRTRRLLRAADGVNNDDTRRRLGGYIGFYSVPTAPQDSRRFTMCLLPGSGVARMIGTRKDRDDVTRVYMMVRGQDATLDAALATGDAAQLKAAYAALFRDGGWECERFVEALLHSREADDLYATPVESVELPPGGWARGRVVLLGDAAFSRTADGSGTTRGFLGAYVLAGEIATRLARPGVASLTDAVVQGARAYEDTLRPVFGTTNVALVGLARRLLLPRSVPGIWLLHTIMSAASSLKLDQWGGWETEQQKWALPEYPALFQKEVAQK